MKIDFYPLRQRAGASGLTFAPAALEPDLEHELPQGEAIARAKSGEVVLVKVWLRTSGGTDLEGLHDKLAAALAPLGLK